jgi:hypothetical protein
MINPRNRAQVDVHDRVERSNAHDDVQASISRNLKSWQDWVDHGYASAFSEAWDKYKMRDVEAITTYVISCGNTRGAVQKTTGHAPGYSEFVS